MFVLLDNCFTPHASCATSEAQLTPDASHAVFHRCKSDWVHIGCVLKAVSSGTTRGSPLGSAPLTRSWVRTHLTGRTGVWRSCSCQGHRAACCVRGSLVSPWQRGLRCQVHQRSQTNGPNTSANKPEHESPQELSANSKRENVLPRRKPNVKV